MLILRSSSFPQIAEIGQDRLGAASNNLWRRTPQIGVILQSGLDPFSWREERQARQDQQMES